MIVDLLELSAIGASGANDLKIVRVQFGTSRGRPRASGSFCPNSTGSKSFLNGAPRYTFDCETCAVDLSATLGPILPMHAPGESEDREGRTSNDDRDYEDGRDRLYDERARRLRCRAVYASHFRQWNRVGLAKRCHR